MKPIVIKLGILLLLIGGTAYAGVPGFMKARMGTLEGVFYNAHQTPHADGIVSFFNVNGGPPPIVGSLRRVPDMVTRTDASGHFSVKLLPGKYYVGALARAVEAGPGPPREGEEYFFAMAEAGKLRVFAVAKKQTNKVGRVDGTTPDQFTEFKNFVVIKGDVKNEDGKPVAGIVVTVKEELNSPRPKFISQKTTGDGRYQLKLPPGRYYIMARESLQAGRPRTGSYIGTYGKAPPTVVADQKKSSRPRQGKAPGGTNREDGGEAVAIDAKPGQTYEGLSIQMYKIPDPDETRRKYEQEARVRNEGGVQEQGK